MNDNANKSLYRKVPLVPLLAVAFGVDVDGVGVGVEHGGCYLALLITEEENLNPHACCGSFDCRHDDCEYDCRCCCR